MHRPTSIAWVSILIVTCTLGFPRSSLSGTRTPVADVSDPSTVPTGILYDRVVQLSKIDLYHGGPDAPAATPAQWKQMTFELEHASSGAPVWPTLAGVLEDASRSINRGIIPMAVLSVEYDRIRKDAFDDGSLAIEEGRLIQRRGNPFARELVHAVTALKDYTHRGDQVTFVLDRHSYLTNLDQRPVSIEIDFDDGRGYRGVAFDRPVSVSYAVAGPKTIRTRTTLDDGRVLYGRFLFRVEHLQTPSPHDTLTITASIPYESGYGTGEAYVYLSDSHASITNPVIVVEGFDLDNSMNWDELYQLLNEQNLIETLRSNGFDAVVLNFTDATDYVQRNSFVLTELIEQVKQELSAYGSIAVVGASMGGVCARYALAYMETHAIDHRVRTFVAFDSPQNGANIPLGVQYWLDFFKDLSGDAAFLLSRLDTPAARQLLVYHHTTPPGTTGESDSLRAVLYDDLSTLGNYPANLRKVAVANGSGSQVGQGFAAGDQIIEYEYSSFLVDLVGNVWAVSNGPDQIIFDGLFDPILLPPELLTVSAAGTAPYDNAPGGWRSSMAQMDSTQAPYGDIVALHPNHCFIPTTSALDLDTADLFYDIAGDPSLLSMSPFDAVYFPLENQEHVSITPENAAWFIDEIELGVVGIASRPAVAPAFALSPPLPNPANGFSEIHYSAEPGGAVTIEVYDVKGSRVATLVDEARVATSSGRVRLDARGLASGVYFVRMQTPSAVLSQKLTVLH